MNHKFFIPIIIAICLIPIIVFATYPTGDLTYYWNFSEGAGTGAVDKVSGLIWNITGAQYSWVGSTPDGDGGIWFNQENAGSGATYGLASQAFVMNTTSSTYVAWMNVGTINNNIADNAVWFDFGAPNTYELLMYDNLTYFSGSILIFNKFYPNIGGWGMVTLVTNSTHTAMYVNNTLLDVAARTQGVNYQLPYFAARADASQGANYSIDNFAVFTGLAMTPDNITDLWNNGVGIFNDNNITPPTPPIYKNISLITLTSDSYYLIPPSNTTIHAVFETTNTSIVNVSSLNNQFSQITPTNWSLLIQSSGDEIVNITEIIVGDNESQQYNFSVFLQLNWTTPSAPSPSYSNDNVSIKYYYFAHTNTQNSSLNLILFVGSFVFLLAIIIAVFIIIKIKKTP